MASIDEPEAVPDWEQEILTERLARRAKLDAERESAQQREDAALRFACRVIAGLDGGEGLEQSDPNLYACILATMVDVARDRQQGDDRSLGSPWVDYTSVEQFRFERDRLVRRIVHFRVLQEAYAVRGASLIADPTPEVERRLRHQRVEEHRGSLVHLPDRVLSLANESTNIRSKYIASLAPTPDRPGLAWTVRPTGKRDEGRHEHEASVARSAGRPGRPEGDGIFRSDEDAEDKIGITVKELVAEGKAATMEAVVTRLMTSGRVDGEVTVRGLGYWVKDKLCYPDWRAYRDAHL